MSNVAIGYPNRLLEATKIHNVSWVDNTNAPLSKIQTPVLAETARTTNFVSIPYKRCSFGISLNSLKYRAIGVVALLNHNLSASSKIRFTVFNEPPLSYATTNALHDITNTTPGLTLTLPVPLNTTLTAGTTLKIYGVSSDSTSSTGAYFYATVVVNDGTLLSVNKGTIVGTGSYKNWYVGAMTTEPVIKNAPLWDFVWRRVYQSTSPRLAWRSDNFWRGAISQDERDAYTKTHISFLKDAITGKQCFGSHLHIDICDDTETINTDLYIELGRVFFGGYTQPSINPEYGAIEHNFIDTSEIFTSNSGTEFYYEKQKARNVSIQWNYLTEDEAFGEIYDASRSQGLTREVLYVFDPDDTGAYQYTRSFIGRFSQLNALTIPNVGLYGASINLKEII